MKEGESTGSLKRVNWDTISDRRLIKVTALVIRKDAAMRRSTDLCRESVCVSACYASVSEDSLMKSASVIRREINYSRYYDMPKFRRPANRNW